MLSMARTKGKPGPKPRYGERRDYHFRLSTEKQEGQTMSLADAFEQEAKRHGGVIRYISEIIQERPEIKNLLQK